MRDNEEAYNRYKIRPRILVNVDNVDISTEIFGCKTALPLGFSPAAMHRLAHPDGEIATSRAAAKIGICMGLSSYATASLEDVAAQGSGNPYVMQLCVLRDRETTLQMLQRAEGEFKFNYARTPIAPNKSCYSVRIQGHLPLCGCPHARPPIK